MLRSHQLRVVAAGSVQMLQSIVFAAELQWRKVRSVMYSQDSQPLADTMRYSTYLRCGRLAKRSEGRRALLGGWSLTKDISSSRLRGSKGTS